MMDYIVQYGIQIMLIFAFGIGSYFIRNYGKQILINKINSLIRVAEENIQGSKLGDDKKAWVIARLEEEGTKVTKKTGKLIDELVKIMNEEKTSLIETVIKSAK